MLRLKALLVLLFCTLFAAGQAQEADAPVDGAAGSETSEAAPRAETGGATTLEDILRRQRGEEVDNAFRKALTGPDTDAAPITAPLGTLGGASDPALWRGIRFGTADITSTASNPGATLLVQDSGTTWLQFREGPLRTYGGYFLLGVIGVLLLFFLLRGRIRIDGGRSGTMIKRFGFIERFGHWLLAGSFIILGLTGLWSLYARLLLRSEAEANTEAAILERQEGSWVESVSVGASWVHDNVAWAFMLGLVLVIVMWVLQNIPNRHDLVWLAKGGGMFSKNSHPPAKKFNAGQKIIFWGVVILGISISLSGLSMLFPFQLPMFAKTFAVLNDTGIPEALGFGVLPETLSPHAEMQLSQAWHAIVAFLFMGLIIGHIYLGTIGMEGAFDAMGSGEVDLQWAKEHHNLWVEELRETPGRKPDPSGGTATPAE